MFNTLKYAKELEAVGVSREQAEAHIKIIAEIVEGDLATKQDIKDVRNDITQLEYRLVIKLGAMATVVTTLAVASVAAILKFL